MHSQNNDSSNQRNGGVERTEQSGRDRRWSLALAHVLARLHHRFQLDDVWVDRQAAEELQHLEPLLRQPVASDAAHGLRTTSFTTSQQTQYENHTSKVYSDPKQAQILSSEAAPWRSLPLGPWACRS